MDGRIGEEMERLETDLLTLARATVYPPTPPLAAAVRRRIEQAPAPRQAMPAWWPAAAGAVVLAVAIIAVAAIAPARDAVAGLFDRINIFETSESPAGLPTDIAGTPVSLQEAESQYGEQLQMPSYPEGLQLEKVLFQRFDTVKAAVQFYRLPSGEEIAFFETTARVQKGIPLGGAPAEYVPNVGREAYWLTGLRITQYADEGGLAVPATKRATDVNTLLWNAGGVVFRIEGNIAKDEAIKIAQSVRRS